MHAQRRVGCRPSGRGVQGLPWGEWAAGVVRPWGRGAPPPCCMGVRTCEDSGLQAAWRGLQWYGETDCCVRE